MHAMPHQGNDVETPLLPCMADEGQTKDFHHGAAVSILKNHHQTSPMMCHHICLITTLFQCRT